MSKATLGLKVGRVDDAVAVRRRRFQFLPVKNIPAKIISMISVFPILQYVN